MTSDTNEGPSCKNIIACCPEGTGKVRANSKSPVSQTETDMNVSSSVPPSTPKRKKCIRKIFSPHMVEEEDFLS